MNCRICLNHLKSNSFFLECAHSFHRHCIEKWIQENNTCPICRYPTTYSNAKRDVFSNRHETNQPSSWIDQRRFCTNVCIIFKQWLEQRRNNEIQYQIFRYPRRFMEITNEELIEDWMKEQRSKRELRELREFREKRRYQRKIELEEKHAKQARECAEQAREQARERAEQAMDRILQKSERKWRRY